MIIKNEKYYYIIQYIILYLVLVHEVLFHLRAEIRYYANYNQWPRGLPTRTPLLCCMECRMQMRDQDNYLQLKNAVRERVLSKDMISGGKISFDDIQTLIHSRVFSLCSDGKP